MKFLKKAKNSCPVDVIKVSAGTTAARLGIEFPFMEHIDVLSRPIALQIGMDMIAFLVFLLVLGWHSLPIIGGKLDKGEGMRHNIRHEKRPDPFGGWL